MPTREQLSEHASTLSDETLIDRLRGRGLTELAEEVTRRELASRGIDVERALSEQPSQTPPIATPPAAVALAPDPRAIRHARRFPLRAALGIEPLWMVALFGAGIVFVTWIVIVVVIGRLLVLSPAPWYVLPTAYIGLTVLALVLAWWGIALWRAGGRAGNIVWMIFARVGALISAFWATFGCMAAAGVVQEYVARGAQRTVMGHPTHTSLAVVIILIIDQLAPIILGVTGILLSYRVLGPRPGTNPKYDAIHGRWAKPFKWLSLASIVFCALQILATILVRA